MIFRADSSSLSVDALLRPGGLHRRKLPAQQRRQLYRLPHQLWLIGLLKIQPEHRRTASAHLPCDGIIQAVSRQITGDLLFFLPFRPLKYLGRQRDLKQTCVLASGHAEQRKRRHCVHFRRADRAVFVRSCDRILAVQTEEQRDSRLHRNCNILMMQYPECDVFLRHYASPSCRFTAISIAQFPRHYHEFLPAQKPTPSRHKRNNGKGFYTVLYFTFYRLIVWRSASMEV